jgi:long-subunit acyl-CoA synthetase (AMP-forming)
MHEAGGRLFVMYGQTEATARMAVLPPDRVGERPGSAGVPIPGRSGGDRHAGAPVDG